MVLEPHLQNVLVGVDAAGLPAEVVFRDLEGTKLVAGRHDLSGLPDRVAEALTYDAERGWNRVVYCLVVNHLAEIAATVAGAARRRPAPTLWADRAGASAPSHAEARRHGRRPLVATCSPGAPLPAKANLAVRWAAAADRAAGYVPIANPLAGAPLGRAGPRRAPALTGASPTCPPDGSPTRRVAAPASCPRTSTTWPRSPPRGGGAGRAARASSCTTR